MEIVLEEAHTPTAKISEGTLTSESEETPLTRSKNSKSPHQKFPSDQQNQYHSDYNTGASCPLIYLNQSDEIMP